MRHSKNAEGTAADTQRMLHQCANPASASCSGGRGGAGSGDPGSHILSWKGSLKGKVFPGTDLAKGGLSPLRGLVSELGRPSPWDLCSMGVREVSVPRPTHQPAARPQEKRTTRFYSSGCCPNRRWSLSACKATLTVAEPHSTWD